MISLISKQSSQVAIPVTPKVISPLLSRPNEILVESGVAVFNFAGKTAGAWTSDTLTVPVGNPVAKTNFLSGIVSGSPASFSTNAQVEGVAITQNQDFITVPVSVQGSDSNGPVFASGTLNFAVPGFVTAANAGIPGTGWAVDSATVTYSTQAGQPVATFSLAVFGTATLLLRVAYTAHIVLGEPGITVVTGTGGLETAKV